ncbi:MAG: hypothetical protein PHR76_05255 [Flavobacterium sp.]|nr:hypothetical protein [Flavobacterium sp.]MDD2985781.1 hypothetical protein [Flavobacterium sp.]
MIKKSLFNLPRNKSFNYTPRYYEGKEQGNIYDFDSKFHKNRETVNYNDFRAHWSDARNESRHRGNRLINFRLLAIVLVLIFIFLVIIDFDLSIFSQK